MLYLKLLASRKGGLETANVEFRCADNLGAQMVGGSSGLNFLAYTRGHKSEYASIAWLSRDASWSWRNLINYFKKSESFHTPGPNTENVTRDFDASVHGTSAPVAVGYPPYISEQFAGGFFDGLEQQGVPVDVDLSDGESAGVSWSASTQTTENVRVTSDTAYSGSLALQVEKNLTNPLLSSRARRWLALQPRHPHFRDSY